MILNPRGSRLLVKKDEGEAQLASGLYLPEEARERPTSGTVVAVGPQQGEFAPGNRVIFGQYAGEELKMDSGTLFILDEEEIMGSLRDSP